MEPTEIVYQKILNMYSLSVMTLEDTAVCVEMKLIKTELVQSVLAVIKTQNLDKYTSVVNRMLTTCLQNEMDDDDYYFAVFEMWLGIYKMHLQFCHIFFRFMFSAKTLKHVDLSTEYLFDKVRRFFSFYYWCWV